MCNYIYHVMFLFYVGISAHFFQLFNYLMLKTISLVQLFPLDLTLFTIHTSQCFSIISHTLRSEDPMDYWVSRLNHSSELAQYALELLASPAASVLSSAWQCLQHGRSAFNMAGGFCYGKVNLLPAGLNNLNMAYSVSVAEPHLEIFNVCIRFVTQTLLPFPVARHSKGATQYFCCCFVSKRLYPIPVTGQQPNFLCLL